MLDARTLLTVFPILSFFVMIFILLMYFNNNNTRSFSYFALSYVLNFLSILMISMIGILPQIFSVITADILFVIHVSLLTISIEILNDRERVTANFMHIMFIVIMTAILLIFTYGSSNYELRNILFTASSIIQYSIIIYIVYTRIKGMENKYNYSPMLISMSLTVILFVLRLAGLISSSSSGFLFEADFVLFVALLIVLVNLFIAYSYLHIISTDKSDELKRLHLLNVSQLERVKKISETDKLTGLSNRHLIDKILNEELNEYRNSGRPFSLVLLDINNFKKINDKYGHLTGDKVIQFVANSLTSVTRNYDLVGRWGGDEFIVILKNSTLKVANKVKENINTYFIENVFSEENLTINCSIGLSEIKPEMNLDDFIKVADSLMYIDKTKKKPN